MCGITGLWTSRTDPSHQTIIQHMTDALIHRGPDGNGFWQAQDTDLHFGHRRLSIIDLSTDGAQPMTSASGRYTMTFNGEFYNFEEIRTALEPHRPAYKGHSDTEIFLHAVDHWGLEIALNKIQGMFAFALWDSKEKILTMAKDRFGKKPLYVGWAGDTLLFSSELKSFHQHPAFEKRVNTGAQNLFMAYGYIPAPNTIFEGVWQLLPGHKMHLRAADLEGKVNLTHKMIPFWSAQSIAETAHKNAAPITEADALKQLETLLSASVSKRMVSDVPLGAFLSGGIDSSIITALMQANSSEKIKTYSIGFAQDEFDEAPFARDIAAHLQTDHSELYVSGLDALNVVPDLAHIHDEPFSDISSIPTYLLSKFARQSVTVALSGDGGDEMLGGYTRHINAPRLFGYVKNLPRFARNIFVEQFENIPVHVQNRLGKAIPFLAEERATHLFQRLLMHSNDPGHWVKNGSCNSYPLEKYVYHGPEYMTLGEFMILGDTLHTLPNKFLTKVDRASMANSLEVRSPFLDTALFEYAWSLPIEMKIRDGRGKWLLRELLKKYVPESLFDRPKQGFNIPLQQWMNRDLRGWAEDLLNTAELEKNGFDAAKVLSAWEGHKDGARRHTNKLWAVCMYQSWARKWL